MRTFIFVICLGVGCMQISYAQSNSILDQLNSGNFTKVETTFSTLQSQFERGMITESNLLDIYKVFYQKEDKFRPQLNHWIDAYPRSSSAYLARGVYYRKLGEYRRGTYYISYVPPENVKYMEQMFIEAKKDLEQSLRLNPKSYLAILNLLNIAQFEGDAAAARKYLKLGNEVLPSNFIVRARYLIQLTPRWGGSYNSMEEFIEQCRFERVSQDKIDMLEAIKFNDQGMVAEEGGKVDQARSAYQKALTLSISGGTQFRQDYLRDAARICIEPENRNKQYCL